MERSRQMTLLCYCVQIGLPVQLEIETLFIILAFVLIKQAGFLSRFHVCFHVFLRSLVPFQRVALGISAAVACRHRGSRVGALGCLMLVLCYGIYKVNDTKSLICLDSLSQPMLRRGSSGPASGSSLRKLESYERRSIVHIYTKHMKGRGQH